MIKAVLMITALLAFSGAAQAQQSPSQPGRYQLITGGSNFQTFMIDTATGRVWRPITFTDLKTDPMVWRLMDRLDSDADISAIIQRYGLKPPDQSNPPAR